MLPFDVVFAVTIVFLIFWNIYLTYEHSALVDRVSINKEVCGTLTSDLFKKLLRETELRELSIMRMNNSIGGLFKYLKVSWEYQRAETKIIKIK